MGATKTPGAANDTTARHECIEFDGAPLCCIEVTGDLERDVRIAASQLEVALRAFPRAWVPETTLRFVARLLSASIRDARCPSGSRLRAARDEQLEVAIVAEFLRYRGIDGAQRLFREMTRERRAERAIRERMH